MYKVGHKTFYGKIIKLVVDGENIKYEKDFSDSNVHNCPLDFDKHWINIGQFKNRIYYECCGKSFENREDLKNHLFVFHLHTKCETCGKTVKFMMAKYRIKSLQLYKCGKCEKSFEEPDEIKGLEALRDHIAKSHGEMVSGPEIESEKFISKKIQIVQKTPYQKVNQIKSTKLYICEKCESRLKFGQ